jgi:hypothetical protein
MTYSVFDSAKGWLASQRELAWQHHGKYHLKGIAQPVDIYEVVNRDLAKPRPPQGARKKRSFPKPAAALVLVLAGIGLSFLFLQIKKTEVWVVRFHPLEMYMDHGARIYLDGEQGQEMRKSLTKIPAGQHVLHYDVSGLVRYYAEISVKRGKNYIEPKFKYLGLPGLTKRLDMYDTNRDSVSGTKTCDYFIYDKNNVRHDRQAVINISVHAVKDTADTNKVDFLFKWNVTMDGKEISSGSTTDSNLITNEETKRRAETVLYEDDFHYMFYRYYMSRASAEFSIGSYFIRYKDR